MKICTEGRRDLRLAAVFVAECPINSRAYPDGLLESGWPSPWNSEVVPLALASATAYAGCLVGVAGLTTGYNPLQWRSEHTG